MVKQSLLMYIRNYNAWNPAKPVQNNLCERFKGCYPDQN